MYPSPLWTEKTSKSQNKKQKTKIKTTKHSAMVSTLANPNLTCGIMKKLLPHADLS